MPEPIVNAAGNPILERILAYGPPGSGKTRLMLSIAKWHQQRGHPAQFWVLDTDNAYDRMMAPARPGEPKKDFEDLTNVHPYDVDTWGDYIDAINDIRANVDKDRGDWAGIDLVAMAWAEAQNEFARRVWGEEFDTYWLDKRGGDDYDPDKDSGSPVDGWDWGVINKMYKNNIERFIMRAPCHILCATTEADIRQPSKSGKGGEDSSTIETFGRLGKKPAGQKHLAHAFHTVIRLAQGKSDWVMTTAKDREREQMKGVVVGNFWHPYLVKNAGWKP